MIQAVEERQRFWARLRRLAEQSPGAESAREAGETPAEPAPQPEAPDPEAVRASLTDEVLFEKLTEKLMWFSGYSQDPDFFKQSLREFVTRSTPADGESAAGSTDTAEERPAG